MSQRKRVLTVCYGGSHASILAAVVGELRQRDRVEVTALALTTARGTFAGRGLRCSGYRDYVDFERRPEIRELGEGLLADVNGADVGVPDDESIAYLGACMAEAIDRLGPEEAWTTYRRIGRHVFLPLRTMAEIVARERPDVVVATNSPKSERAAIAVANRAGIPTLIVPDFLAEPDLSAYAPFEAQWFAAMSSVARRNLIDGHGAAPHRVLVTGQPSFDKSHVPAEAECRRYATQVTGISAESPYLLVGTSQDMGTIEALGLGYSTQSPRALALVLKTLPQELPVIVKPHPSERVDMYCALVEGRPGTHLVPGSADLNRLARGAIAAVLTSPTFAIADTLALDRRTVALDLAGSAGEIDYAALGAVMVREPEGIQPAIRQLLGETREDPDKARARHDLAQANAGSGARVTDLVERLAGVV